MVIRLICQPSGLVVMQSLQELSNSDSVFRNSDSCYCTFGRAEIGYT